MKTFEQYKALIGGSKQKSVDAGLYLDSLVEGDNVYFWTGHSSTINFFRIRKIEREGGSIKFFNNADSFVKVDNIGPKDEFWDCIDDGVYYIVGVSEQVIRDNARYKEAKTASLGEC